MTGTPSRPRTVPGRPSSGHHPRRPIAVPAIPREGAKRHELAQCRGPDPGRPFQLRCDPDPDRAPLARSRLLRGPAGTPLHRVPDGRAVHLLRPDGAFRVPARTGHGRAAPSAYRPVHRHLLVRRRDHAPRQPRHRTADPAGRAELDDGGSRHHPFGAHRPDPAADRLQAVRHPELGRLDAIATRRTRRPSSITTPPRCRS